MVYLLLLRMVNAVNHVQVSGIYIYNHYNYMDYLIDALPSKFCINYTCFIVTFIAVDCDSIMCDWPSCANGLSPIILEGECCPSCPGEHPNVEYQSVPEEVRHCINQNVIVTIAIEFSNSKGHDLL